MAEKGPAVQQICTTELVDLANEISSLVAAARFMREQVIELLALTNKLRNRLALVCSDLQDGECNINTLQIKYYSAISSDTSDDLSSVRRRNQIPFVDGDGCNVVDMATSVIQSVQKRLRGNADMLAVKDVHSPNHNGDGHVVNAVTAVLDSMRQQQQSLSKRNRRLDALENNVRNVLSTMEHGLIESNNSPANGGVVISPIHADNENENMESRSINESSELIDFESSEIVDENSLTVQKLKQQMDALWCALNISEDELDSTKLELEAERKRQQENGSGGGSDSGGGNGHGVALMDLRLQLLQSRCKAQAASYEAEIDLLRRELSETTCKLQALLGERESNRQQLALFAQQCTELQAALAKERKQFDSLLHVVGCTDG